MDKLDKVQKLHRLFSSCRYPVRIATIEKELECTKKTAKAAIDILRDRFNAPLIYCEKERAWQYDKSEDAFELAGLWLTSDELHSLSAILNIIATMEEGLLGKEINIVHKRIEQLLNAQGIDVQLFTQNIKYLSINKRLVISQHFSTIVEALINAKQLLINYTDYNGKSSQRIISPQNLIHYQENWYLDAWCHKREALRSFMLSRIGNVIRQTSKKLTVQPDELANHYGTSYGIFAGEPKHIAVLKFSQPVIHEVVSVKWHPDQKIEAHSDSIQIEIPYNDDRELIRDILKFGENVEVIQPQVLKNKIKGIVQNMLDLYS